MAAPHISAACAIILLSHPSYSPSQLESFLKGICTDLGPSGHDVDYGYGIPNLSSLAPSVPQPKPDLAPTQITFGSDVAVGQHIYFDSGVANSGDADSGSFYVKWEINNVQEGYGQHSSVSANTTVMDGNSSLFWTPASPGNYTVKFIVDSDGTITEEDESNNSVTTTVVVPEPVYKPDLAPTSIAYDSNIAVNRQIEFVSCIANYGNISSNEFTIKWEVNGELKYHTIHNGIPANTSRSDLGTHFFWTPTSPGSYTITITVDFDNSVTEENELNNSITETIVVPEPVYKPDLVPLSILPDASSITVGQQMGFSANIANYGYVDSAAFAVKWEINGELKSYGMHEGIPNRYTAYSGSRFLWTPTTPGYYTFTFTVDSDNIISEENESNNQISSTIYVNPPPPQSITISHSNLFIGVGQGISVLSATVLPAESNKAITWTSMNTNIATVSNTGYIYGKGIGSTVIRASTINGLYKDCVINVAPSGKGVIGISLSKGIASIDEGKTLKLTVKLSPRSPANKTIRWSSSNSSVASVDGKGAVFGSKPGTAVITATASSGIMAQCAVTVNSLAVTQVKLSKTYLAVDEGKTASLTASALPKNARFKTITWSSSNPSIATVSTKGKITTYKPGTVQITATAHNGVSASCTLTVRSLAVTTIAISKAELTLKRGKTSTLKAILTPRNARYKVVTWVSSSPSIVTVTATGKIKAIGQGTAIISVIAHNGLTASCRVIVP